ncbi:hypothetical protein Slin_4766 [Spirosoma linguale DSM 74]|uniref:Uncharacterized protein n=1 Tax=Spirosoma linguale (strain ATCC 33905 / DSM 74 / LMG 10896 / Claus 1) TaxID=504472 RepID=D2QQG3_SPILD|nr:hypothetical protein Slin_4766 [Spirosoma linguale DSM 74]
MGCKSSEKRVNRHGVNLKRFNGNEIPLALIATLADLLCARYNDCTDAKFIKISFRLMTGSGLPSIDNVGKILFLLL